MMFCLIKILVIKQNFKMMEHTENLIKSSSSSRRYWMKVPLIIRAILVGFGVNTLGVGSWVLLTAVLPLPWAIFSMAIVLILFWKYFSGKWKPEHTQEFRKFCFRKVNLKKEVWIWGIIGSVSFFAFLNLTLVLTFRFVEFQPEIFKTASLLNDMPIVLTWAVIIMASLVAGICEEIGFRGYMQVPLEKKYGHFAGIMITSIVFLIAHLHQAWASGIEIQIIIFSCMIGYLAYASNSLLPGIIAHISFDIINFSYWWSDVIGTFSYKPISITGIDTHFIFSTTLFLIATLVFIYAISKLMKLKVQEANN